MYATVPLIFTFVFIWVPFTIQYQGIKKVRNGLTADAKRIFADWKAKGLGVVFLPGEKPASNTVGNLMDTPNIIRVILPVADGQPVQMQ
jgi:hypothetical protein